MEAGKQGAIVVAARLKPVGTAALTAAVLLTLGFVDYGMGRKDAEAVESCFATYAELMAQAKGPIPPSAT